MPGVYGSLAALLASIALLYGGNTLMSTLLPVRAGQEGFDAVFVGGMGTGYFIGFIFGCQFTPWLVRRVGHIRAFGAMAAIAASTTLCFVLFLDPASWIALRLIYGVVGAGLLMVVETAKSVLTRCGTMDNDTGAMLREELKQMLALYMAAYFESGASSRWGVTDAAL